jgi:hypothetical protein
MKLALVLVAVVACRGDEPKKSEPAPVVAPAAPEAPAPDAEVEPDASARELAQQEIADSINTLLQAGGAKNSFAAVSEDDLMIMTPPGECDRKALDNLRKGMAALKLDPAKAFATMQCNGGPVLRFR